MNDKSSKPLLNFGLFQELSDLNYFLMAKVEHGTVVWPHEQDICPDTLYLEGKEIVETKELSENIYVDLDESGNMRQHDR